MQTYPGYHFPTQTYLNLQAVPTLREHQEHPQWLAPSFKTEKTEQDQRVLYEQQCKMNPLPPLLQEEDSPKVKSRIQMAMILLNQNQQLAKKIQQVSQQLEEERLKTCIFSQQISKNDDIIALLRKERQEAIQKQQQMERMNTLNESLIPSKSHQMSTTYNTSSWINEFLDKESLQSLWNSKNLKENTKRDKQNIKHSTIDLTSHLSDRHKKDLLNAQSNKITHIKEDSIHQKQQIRLKLQKNKEKNKKTILSVAHNVKQTSVRYESKFKLQQKNKKYGQLYEKKNQTQKPVTYLRNQKKLKNKIEI